MKPFFFDEQKLLPDGFQYPDDYRALANDECWPDIEPWSTFALNKAKSLSYLGYMTEKYPSKPLVPFAYIDDQSGLYNDGWIVLACFDACDLSPQPRVRIYDASVSRRTPWDNASYANFNEWLNAARLDSASYKRAKAESDLDE